MEPELGLGIVLNADSRLVTLLFHGNGETRVYSAANAPLKRVRFNIGDTVKSASGKEFTIEQVDESGGILTYSGDGVSIKEAQLSGDTSFCKPEARLLSGHFDAHELFDLRLEALRKKHFIRSSELRGLSGGRVELIPHQFYIAHEALTRHRPRLLLADEVGLGKTIEACLIMHGLLLRGLASRILVIVPEVLVNQWFVELRRKFNLNFSIIDADSLEDADVSPFEESQLCLCSIKTAVSARWQALGSNWDMLIVDEAHHLRWSKEQASVEYELVETLAARTPAVLLLTATPEHHGLEGHFARLRLLDPERYYNLEKFNKETRHYRRTAEVAGKLIKGEELVNAEIKYLATLISHDSPVKLDYNSARSREKFISDLLDRHGVGRVMFRNTRSAMTDFPRRRPRLIPLLSKENTTLQAETRYLADFLLTHPRRKVLLICGDMGKAISLKDTLAQLCGVITALFHEGMTLIQRDRAAAWFAEPDGARMMICSEIGSEGRNFQFAHDLVLLDLPLDPELLEQRIGRLDRIGQTSDIRIHVPYVKGTGAELLARWYHEGLDSFAHPLHGGTRIMKKFEPELKTLLSGDCANSAVNELILRSAEFRRKVEAELDQGRDKLLEMNSFRPGKISGLMDMLKANDDDCALEKFMLEIFENFGIKYEEMSERSYLLKPDDLLTDAFPCVSGEGLTVTYSRARALVRDDVQFLSWDHPMVTGSIDLLIGSERGNSSIARLPGGKRGIILQTVYLLESVAPSELHIERFLPPSPIMICINEQHEEVDAPKPSRLTGCKTLPAPESLKNTVPDMLAASAGTARTYGKRILAESLHNARKFFNHEIKRMQALKEVNDHIRDEEISLRKDHLAGIEKHLKSARLRLDSLRLIFTGS